MLLQRLMLALVTLAIIELTHAHTPTPGRAHLLDERLTHEEILLQAAQIKLHHLASGPSYHAVVTPAVYSPCLATLHSCLKTPLCILQSNLTGIPCAYATIIVHAATVTSLVQ